MSLTNASTLDVLLKECVLDSMKKMRRNIVNQDVTTAAAKLYAIMYPEKNFYNLRADTQRFYMNVIKELKKQKVLTN